MVMRPSARAQIGMIEHAYLRRGKQGAQVKCIDLVEECRTVDIVIRDSVTRRICARISGT
jgi:sarcosine oxidase delta subunit